MNETLLAYARKRVEDPALLFHGGMGLCLIEFRKGYVETEVLLEDRHRNPSGGIHGGLLMSMADDTAGAAVISHGANATTSSCSMNFLRANPKAKKIVAKATAIKVGTRLGVSEVKLYDDQNTLLATGLFEYAILNDI